MSEKQTIQLCSGTIAEYEIRKSRRAKRSSLTLYPDGRLVAVIPWFRTTLTAIRLVNQHKAWIEKQLKKIKVKPNRTLPSITKRNRHIYAKQASLLFTTRVEYFSKLHGFNYNRVCTKIMRSQWGSCSPKKNLNFNIKLIFLPEDLIDYIVVHELCHLKEMNHGRRFWNLVTNILPDYKAREKRLSK